jgi:hypothetical protein
LIVRRLRFDFDAERDACPDHWRQSLAVPHPIGGADPGYAKLLPQIQLLDSEELHI